MIVISDFPSPLAHRPRQIVNIGLQSVIFGANLCRQSSFVGYCETSVDRESRHTSKQKQARTQREIIMLFLRRRSTNLKFLLKLPQLMLLHCTAAATTYRRHLLRHLDNVHHVQRGSSSAVSDINLQRVQSQQVRSLFFFLFVEAIKHVIFFWFRK